MDVYHVTHNGSVWCFRAFGSAFDIRCEPADEDLRLYVERYMSHHTGRVLFHEKDGTVVSDRTYASEPDAEAATDREAHPAADPSDSAL